MNLRVLKVYCAVKKKSIYNKMLYSEYGYIVPLRYIECISILFKQQRALVLSSLSERGYTGYQVRIYLRKFSLFVYMNLHDLGFI